jgi:2-polyprenyl-3-methyl-5-hydroxy-6-metoxy-1,4-benzoquinol methylase
MPTSLKHRLRLLGAAPFGLLPAAARRRLVQLIITGTASGDAAAGLRQLLQMDEDLSGAIDELAMTYGDGVHPKHRLTRYHDFFVERIRSGERVLDVGCGYGAVAHSVAARSGARVTGLDMDAANVAAARRMFPHRDLEFVVGRAPDELPAGGFDVIVASNVLEHIDDRRGFLTSIQERCEPARWLVRVPMIDRAWQVALRQELGVRHFCDPTHFVEYTRDSFEREMAETGFTVRHLQVNWGEIWAEVAR